MAVRFSMSSPGSFFATFVGVFALVVGYFVIPKNAFVGTVTVVGGLVLIVLSITGDPWGMGGPGVLGLWPLKGRLNYVGSEVTIYSLGLAAGYNSRYAINQTDFGDCVVRFRVRRRGIPFVYNVRFSPETFEEFKKSAGIQKPTILSWEFG